MIDIVNTKNLSLDQRKASLSRAIHSQPFLNLLEFKPIAAANVTRNYAATQRIDKDFWLTNVQGIFEEDSIDVKAQYFMSLYVADEGDSIYRYIADENLPAAFQATSANSIFPAGSRFDDRQRELMPRLIKSGNSLIGNMLKRTGSAAVTNVDVVISGYYTYPNAYVPDRAVRGIQESLDDKIRFDEWKFSVTEQGSIIKTLQNDRFARMVLGFGIVNKPLGILAVSNGTFQVSDGFRNIKLCNVPINIAFFGPKQYQQSQDQHITYLPVEYFWEPFAPLKFEVANDVGITLGAGYDLIMLTRTV